jgi:hypothetical protein
MLMGIAAIGLKIIRTQPVLKKTARPCDPPYTDELLLHEAE